MAADNLDTHAEVLLESIRNNAHDNNIYDCCGRYCHRCVACRSSGEPGILCDCPEAQAPCIKRPAPSPVRP